MIGHIPLFTLHFFRRVTVDFLLLCALLTGCHTTAIRPGDLLFHVSHEANAITDVTPGMIDHVAIALSGDSVIEAIGRGVIVTSVDSLRQQPGHYLIGRVRKAAVQLSLDRARACLGYPYDSLYLPDNEAVYCSELVQLAFVDRHGKQLFSPVPMSFHDATGQITAYWREFYGRQGLTVPEGEPGTNPAEMSQRKQVNIIGRLRLTKAHP